ncbi:mechanosensitive ion channel domain-containing protein [Microvirga antarctica]|uniref:mechanosensitive ion channel domain-containing protein n=1 Tax=Microvirga antarctica TaxID=2819233 RepID=UPI001B305EFA|nr:mechanosensitive ion channel domain-containing protein [Microvirga antarctica]
MRLSRRKLIMDAGMPIICVVLMGLFVALQFLATPPALGNLRYLAPAETSTPRATIEGFRAHTAQAAALLMEAYRQNTSEPGLTWSKEVKDKVKEAETLLARAARTLDLSNVPPVELEHRRLEATLLLKEILDRLPLPAPDSIPALDGDGHALPSWTVPGTEIRIARILDGPRAGEYLFSSHTVAQLPQYYQLIRDEPNTDGSTGDFYGFFSQSPGYLLPPKWFALIEMLPAPFRSEVQGQAVWQWIGLFLTIAIAVGLVTGVWRLSRARSLSPDWPSSLTASILVPGSVMVAAMMITYVTDFQINLTGMVNDVVEAIAEAIAYLAAVWGILKFSGALANKLTFRKSESIDAHLARAAVRIGGIGCAIALLIYGASYLGLPLAGLLAGLGVGGLAVALAAKPTLENFIGGLILYADRPVRVGDLCRVGNLEGRVQEIGIRSTRIRGLDRSLITIPNATFVNLNIINLTNRDSMPYNRTVALRSTDSLSIRREVEGLEALVGPHTMILPGTLEVRLREGQEEKPKAEIRALIATSSWEIFLQVQKDIDLMLRDALFVPDTSSPPDESRTRVFPLKDDEAGQKASA